MNYAGGEIPYTRIHEFKHYHPERRQVFESPKTVICREYPSPWREGMEPYYPVNNPENNRLQEKYLQEASRIPNFFAGGRQGEYRYFDMDRTIRNALDMLNKIKEQFFK